MPSMTDRRSMATGTSVVNIFSGQQYELAPFDGTIMLGIKADKNLVTAFVAAGPDILSEAGPVSFAASEAMPVYPDDYSWRDHVAHNDRLKVNLVNGNAGTAIVNSVMRIDPS